MTQVLKETIDPGGPNEETIHYLHGLDLIAESDGTSTDYFAYDGLGSVRQLVDSSAGVLLTQTFDPYGNLYASAGSAQSAYGYTGEYQDANGLLFLRARYYNPTQGRFFQRDPASGSSQSPQSFNPYAYSEGNPINFADPSGRDICIFGLRIKSAINIGCDRPARSTPLSIPSATPPPTGTLSPEIAPVCTPDALGIFGTAAASISGGSSSGILGIPGVDGVQIQSQLAGQATGTPIPAQSQLQQQATATPQLSPTPTGTPQYPRILWFPGGFGTGSQLDRKFKHAADFGIIGSSNEDNRRMWAVVLLAFVHNHGVSEQYAGTFRGQPTLHYVNPTTHLWVGTGLNGGFNTGFRLQPHQLSPVVNPPHALGGAP